MVESFTIGMTTAFLVRSFTLRILKWPLTSSTYTITSGPLYIIPEMIAGGLFFSLFDYLRRSSLEKTLKYE